MNRRIGVLISGRGSNLQAIIDRTRQKFPDVTIVLAGMRMPPNLGAEYVQQFEKLFATIAKENNTAFVPFLLEGVGGESRLNQADRIHPTAEGQRLVAENVWRIVKPLVASRGGAASPRAAGG